MELKITLIKDEKEIERKVIGIRNPLTGSNVKLIIQAVMTAERDMDKGLGKDIDLVAVPKKKKKSKKRQYSKK